MRGDLSPRTARLFGLALPVLPLEPTNGPAVAGWGQWAGLEWWVGGGCDECLVFFSRVVSSTLMHLTFPQGRNEVSAFNLVFSGQLSVFTVCVCV